MKLLSNKTSLYFLLAATLLASCTQILPAQMPSRWGWLSGAFKNNWGQIACVAVIASAAYLGFRYWQIHRAHNTLNISHAIHTGNEPAIAYWLSKTTRKNVDIAHHIPTPTSHLVERFSALDIAIYVRDLETVKQLLKKGANPNLLQMYPAMVDAMENPEYLELLLQHGLNPNVTRNQKTHPVRPGGFEPYCAKLLEIFIKQHRARNCALILAEYGASLTPEAENRLNSEQIAFWRETIKRVEAEKGKRLAGLKHVKNGIFPPGVPDIVAGFADLKSAVNFSVASKTLYQASGRQVPQAAQAAS